MTEFDPVQKPKHYASHPSGIEVIEVAGECSFLIGNAVKYLFRAGLKGDEVQDLQKALWYLKYYANRRYSPPAIPDTAVFKYIEMVKHESGLLSEVHMNIAFDRIEPAIEHLESYIESVEKLRAPLDSPPAA